MKSESVGQGGSPIARGRKLSLPNGTHHAARVCCAKCRRLVHRDEAVPITEDGVYMRICLTCLEDEGIRMPIEVEL
jgi:hypothetical protein